MQIPKVRHNQIFKVGIHLFSNRYCLWSNEKLFFSTWPTLKVTSIIGWNVSIRLTLTKNIWDIWGMFMQNHSTIKMASLSINIFLKSSRNMNMNLWKISLMNNSEISRFKSFMFSILRRLVFWFLRKVNFIFYLSSISIKMSSFGRFNCNRQSWTSRVPMPSRTTKQTQTPLVIQCRTLSCAGKHTHTLT